MQLHLLEGYHVGAIVIDEVQLLHLEVPCSELVGAYPELFDLVVHED